MAAFDANKDAALTAELETKGGSIDKQDAIILLLKKIEENTRKV